MHNVWEYDCASKRSWCLLTKLFALSHAGLSMSKLVKKLRV